MSDRDKKPKRRRPKAWTQAEDRQLRALWPDLHAATVARAIGRTENAIRARAVVLGLRKSAAYKSRHQDNRWQPGNTPWNKGRKGSTGYHAKTRANWFGKGQQPHNTLDVGTYRIVPGRGKGPDQLQRKTSTTPGAPHKRWTPVTRLVWEAAHGPVPPGHIVIWRDLRLATTELADITADKLVCISRQEHAARNHPASKDPELAKLAQLRGAINRQINRINREHRDKT